MITSFPFIPLFCRRNLMNIGMDPTKNINVIAKQKRHKDFSWPIILCLMKSTEWPNEKFTLVDIWISIFKLSNHKKPQNTFAFIYCMWYWNLVNVAIFCFKSIKCPNGKSHVCRHVNLDFFYWTWSIMSNH